MKSDITALIDKQWRRLKGNGTRLVIPGTQWVLDVADRHPASCFLFPAVMLLVALTIFPFLYSLLLSFHRWNLTSRLGTWSFVGFKNYYSIFAEDPFFWSAVRVTASFLVVTVSVEFLLGLVIALLLSQEAHGLDIMRTIVVVPMMITPTVVGLIWRFMYNPDLGMVNYLLSILGLQGPVWLGSIRTAFLSVVIADVWEWTPFMILIMLAALQSLPGEPLEAAIVDGASRWQLFRYIVLPMIQPAMVVALLLRAMDSFKTFDLIYVLTQGGPGVSTQTLSLYTYKWGFKFFEMGYAAALSYVMLIAIDIIATASIRRMRQK